MNVERLRAHFYSLTLVLFLLLLWASHRMFTFPPSWANDWSPTLRVTACLGAVLVTAFIVPPSFRWFGVCLLLTSIALNAAPLFGASVWVSVLVASPFAVLLMWAAWRQDRKLKNSQA